MAARGTVVIDSDRCKGCELCVAACPHQVLYLSDLYNARGYRQVMLKENGSLCTGCAVCAVICPDVVFTVYRQSRQAGAQTVRGGGNHGERIVEG